MQSPRTARTCICDVWIMHTTNEITSVSSTRELAHSRQVSSFRCCLVIKPSTHLQISQLCLQAKIICLECHKEAMISRSLPKVLKSETCCRLWTSIRHFGVLFDLECGGEAVWMCCVRIQTRPVEAESREVHRLIGTTRVTRSVPQSRMCQSPGNQSCVCCSRLEKD